jgi:hypothetical protein
MQAEACDEYGAEDLGHRGLLWCQRMSAMASDRALWGISGLGSPSGVAINCMVQGIMKDWP